MKIELIICIVAVCLIGFTIPNACAASGEITVEKTEFTLSGDGNMVHFSVSGEISDYLYYPELEIINNNEVIQIIELFPAKNSFFTVIGLDKDWAPGEYSIHLTYQNKILDSKSFNIFRDNFVEKEIRFDEKMFDIDESFIELNVEKLILENNSDEMIMVSGNLVSSQFGNKIDFLLNYPDNSIQNIGTVQLPRDGF